MERRHQEQTEKFCEFCQDIEAIAVRLRRQMSEDELLEILCRNMSIYLRKALWREQFETVDDVLVSCNEYESLRLEEKQQSSLRKQMRVNEMSYQDQYEYPRIENEAQHNFIEAVQPKKLLVCWNCRELGHLFNECGHKDRGVFCFSCGLSGMMKFNCHKYSGNARQDMNLVGGPRNIMPAQPQLLSRPPHRVHITRGCRANSTTNDPRLFNHC